MKSNENYEYLRSNGFGVEIKSGSCGYASMYLLREGKRILKTGFKDNKEKSSDIQRKIYFARKNSHLDNAMYELRYFADLYLSGTGFSK